MQNDKVAIGNGTQYIEVNGSQQAVMASGSDIENPLLLFLHGGPGFSQIPFAPKYQKRLQAEFTVINWDQRGAGLSYDKKTSPETMCFDQFLDDAVQVVKWALQKYNKDKIYVVGHSWGTYLGIRLAQTIPEKIHAYVGVSQVVDVYRASVYEYDKIKKLACDKNINKAMNDLEGIVMPYYLEDKSFFKVRKWSQFFNPVKEIDMVKLVLGACLKDHTYKLRHVPKYFKGLNFSQKYIREDVYENLNESSLDYEVPVYFLTGEYDWTTPTEIVSEYYESLRAPDKDIFIIKDAGHSPHLENPPEVHKILFNIKDKLKGL